MKRLIFLLVPLLLMGCTHSLRITNAETFIPSLTKPSQAVRIGFIPNEDILLDSVIEEISLDATVKEAKKGYQIGSGVEVDYVSELSKDMKFRAAGQNFFITIPGFLIFTHALLGYRYYIDIDTLSKLLDPRGEILSEATISTPYKIRYTSFARGAATSLIGWLAPGYGLLDIIPGAIFAFSYDKRATPEFIEKVKPSYKAFVSSKVLEQIAMSQRTSSYNLKYFFEMEPVVIGNEVSEDFLNNANDRLFMIYVMEVQDGRLTMLTDKLREVTEETWQMLDRIAKKEIMLDAKNLENILSPFGIPDMPFPKDMGSVGIYTMQGDKIIALFKGNGSDLQVAAKLGW